MKTMKKVLVVALALCLCMTAFAGCGSKEEATEFFIGGSGPLTGGAASYGISVRNGATIAVEEINAAGGINGIQVKFEMMDDEHDPAKANTAVNRLIDDGMHVLMGAVTTAPSLEVGELTKEANIFQITPSASAAACAQYDNQFRTCFTDPLQGRLSAQFLAEDFSDVTKVGVLYNSADAYSAGIKDAFKAELPSSIVLTERSFTDETNTDFGSQIEAFKSAGCEFVFLPFYAQEAVAVLSQAKAKSYSPTFMGCDGLDGIIGLASDVAEIENVIYLTPFLSTADDEATKSFVSSYKSKYSATPDQFAADGYDAIYTIKEAIEKAGIDKASISPSDLCEAMKTAMTQIEVAGLTGTTTWTADGEPTKAAMFVVVKNGVAQKFSK